MKLPFAMLTQHPDSASRYVPIQEEPDEAVRGLSPAPGGLGADEIMIDFEGKMTPYHQPSQIVMALLERDIVPGRDVFITPRIASASKETVFRQLMALMSLVETNVQAGERGAEQAVREVIVPMCETPEELLAVRKRVGSVIELAHKEFGLPDDPNLIRLIPLVEGVPELLGIDRILSRYLIESGLAGGGSLRFLLGRSDPALSYGLVPAVLAGRAALARAAEVAESLGVEIAAILGAGALPFRGHVTAGNLDGVLETFPGVRTVTIQSALRYDHGEDAARQVCLGLRQRLAEPANQSPTAFTREEFDELHRLIAIFTRHYLETFFDIIDLVCALSDIMPKQRDRLARFSAVGYARDVARPDKLAALVPDAELADGLRRFDTTRKVSLPRAIAFTAALYTIGLPPEFIGTGRGLAEVKERYGSDGLAALERYYPTLRNDLAYAGRFLNLGSAKAFLSPETASDVTWDVRGVTEVLGVTPGPQTPEDEFYVTLVETTKPILKHFLGLGHGLFTDDADEARLVADWIIRMGKMRGSLG
ncbi:MAG: phosphoenolpyruvate carboxylase [Bacillota bacterium]|nr:MAG: phosphoenolpyruvate carboxylase [Bacillota bacterium]